MIQIQLVTAKEAIKSGLTHSKLLREGHGAFGEPENSYEDIVYVGKKAISLSKDDLVLYRDREKDREVLEVLSEWDCSDKLLEIMNPELLARRKKSKYDRYLELKKEIESDPFYKQLKNDTNSRAYN